MKLSFMDPELRIQSFSRSVLSFFKIKLNFSLDNCFMRRQQLKCTVYV